MSQDQLSDGRRKLGASHGFFHRVVAHRSKSRGYVEGNEKGPLGLTTVYKPLGKAVADLVFIHGLGGGSRYATFRAGLQK